MEKLCADICGVICICILVFIGCSIFVLCNNSSKKAKKQAEEDKIKLGELINKAEGEKKQCKSALSNCFRRDNISYAQTISAIEGYLSSLEKTNTEIGRLTRDSSQEYAIKDYRSKCEELTALQRETEKFEIEHSQNLGYGKITKAYFETVQQIPFEQATTFVKGCEGVVIQDDVTSIRMINLEQLLKCIWVFAISEPFDQATYNKAAKLFNILCKKKPVKVYELVSSICDKKRKIESSMAGVEKKLVHYLLYGNYVYNTTYPYATTQEYDELMYQDTQKTITEAEQINDEIIALSELETIMPIITPAKTSLAAFRVIIDKRKAYRPFHLVTVSPSSYGTVNGHLWDKINAMDKTTVDNARVRWNSYLYEDNLIGLSTIDFDDVLKAVWFYAIAKPFSADEFKATVKVFRALTIEWSQLDMLIPELYSINSIGGDNAVTKHVGAFLSKEEDGGGLKYKSGSYLYSELASALMWMKAHQAEHLVLKAMLDHQLEMTQKMQERLHAFSSGRGDTPKVLDVDLKSLEVNIDLSSLAWNDDAYEGFFENLAFQEKSLPYALAIRDDDTALLLGQRIEYLGMEDICGRIKTVFQDEFGYDASVKIADCVILSGSGREQMRGILAYSKECSQLCVGMFINSVGKKINIKFYTLLIPVGSQVSEQKQQALSMFKRLSPKVTTWESSLKDSMLIGVQQLLNSGTQPSGNANNTIVPSAETIF